MNAESEISKLRECYSDDQISDFLCDGEALLKQGYTDKGLVEEMYDIINASMSTDNKCIRCNMANSKIIGSGQDTACPAPKTNAIQCADCFDFLPSLPDASVDLIITDPPYSTPTVTSFGRTLVKNVGDFSIQETYIKMLKVEFERILKPEAPVFMFCDDSYYPSIFRAFYNWRSIQMLVWDKGKIGMGSPFRKRHELIVYANRSVLDYNRTDGITHYPTVLCYKPVGKSRIHGAQKPVELVRDLILGFSQPNDVVADFFMGSGTTAEAALLTGRNFIGSEISEEYCRIAEERIHALKRPSAEH